MQWLIGVISLSAWFLRAYFADRSGQNKTVAMQYYNSIVDVLEWGAKTWHDVPTSDRGVIFLKTFVRAVKRIRMEAYLSVRCLVAGCPIACVIDGYARRCKMRTPTMRILRSALMS